MKATDIRILKTIGVVAETAKSMQLELNIVSINGGEIKYDLREWSLDHDKVGQGVSFSTDGAQVLLALLKECFKDGGEGIDISSLHIPEPNLFREPVIETVKPQIDTTVCDLLKAEGIEFTDKREKGGALWVAGGHELDSVMLNLAQLGHKFTFSEKGGKQTKGKPGWYLRGPKA